jgi:lipoate-protein ligase A
MISLEFPSLPPAEILAAEEALLDAAESGTIGETLSFWEARQYFVVLGYGNKLATEVNRTACKQLKIPILRRCSGGGTVLQGPGVLNYSLVLRATERGPFAGISGANRIIMQRNAEALGALLGGTIDVEGHTDLAIGGRKFSGNAQRRKRSHLLFHGAILMNLDMDLLDAVLPMPSLQPEYRAGRSHAEFLTQLRIQREHVKQALRTAWAAEEQTSLDALLGNWRVSVEKLVAEKYSRAEWNFRV